MQTKKPHTAAKRTKKMPQPNLIFRETEKVTIYQSIRRPETTFPNFWELYGGSNEHFKEDQTML
ncbi:hypothetical protein TSUD_208900 [Trifolium subterraneum]|uniref:Uncharacterized protein n=1 Tax=Trifolium subterraneum TaxID=3900 RepID=A0A2Z6N7N7_TRISU|nr:hypothetical protein TSUD_208900 [Trifolium subterraneum]